MASTLFSDIVCALIVRSIYKRNKQRSEQIYSENINTSKRTYLPEPIIDSDEEQVVDIMWDIIFVLILGYKTLYLYKKNWGRYSEKFL